MQKQISPRFVLFKKIVAAIVVFNQAVFLLATAAPAKALYVANQATGQTASTGTTDLSDLANPIALSLEFAEVPSGAVTGTRKFLVKSNLSDALVYFNISGPKTANFFAQHTAGSLEYWFNWDTKLFPNGDYTLSAYASKSGLASIKKDLAVAIENENLSIEGVSQPVGSLSGVATLTVKLNQPDAVVGFEISGPKWATLPAAHEAGSAYYSLKWDTANYPNGNYIVKINAYKNGQNVTKDISVTVENKAAASVPPATSSSIPAEQAPASGPVVPLAISHLSLFSTAISGTARLVTQTNSAVDKVKFKLEGPKTIEFAALQDENTNFYYFDWDTATFPNGNYKLTAMAAKGTEFASRSNYLEVKNAAAETTSSTVATTTAADSSVTLGFEDFSSVFSGDKIVKLRSSHPLDSLRFLVKSVSNGESFTLIGPQQWSTVSGREGYYYSFTWNTLKFRNGGYTLMAVGIKGGQEYKSESKTVSLYNQPTASTTAASSTPTITAPPQAIDQATSTSLAPKAVEGQPASTTPIKVTAPATDGQAKNVKGIEIIRPGNNQALEETTMLVARSNGTIKRAEFYRLKDKGELIILGRARLNASGHEWELPWATRYLPDGNYILKARAWDERNKPVWSQPVTVAKKAAKAEQPIKAVASVAELADKAAAIDQAVDAASSLTVERPAAPAQEAEKADSATDLSAGGNSVLARCQQVGLTSFGACQAYLFEQEALVQCRADNRKTREDCADYLLKKNSQPTVCAKLYPAECREFVKFVILADFIDEKVAEGAAKEIKALFGKNIEIKPEIASSAAAAPAASVELSIKEQDGPTPLPAQAVENLKTVIPFRHDEPQVNLMVLPAAAPEGQDKAEAVIPAVLLLDSDSDGLTDDIERRLGTDPKKADTDGDGYVDGTEVANGHNPLGSGNHQLELKPIEKAILKKAALEQPRTSQLKADASLAVGKVATAEAAAASSTSARANLKFEGKARPNEVVTLYIYSSLPIVITVSADANGNWIYELDKSLVDGKHEAYVVINDDDGRIKSKSAPFSFFVKEAKAVTEEDFLADKTSSLDPANSMIIWYATAGAAMIVFAVGLVFLYQRSRRIS